MSEGNFLCLFAWTFVSSALSDFFCRRIFLPDLLFLILWIRLLLNLRSFDWYNSFPFFRFILHWRVEKVYLFLKHLVINFFHVGRRVISRDFLLKEFMKNKINRTSFSCSFARKLIFFSSSFAGLLIDFLKINSIISGKF